MTAIPELEDVKRLIRRAQRGDMEAFEALVRRYERQVYNIALQMLVNSQDAEDCAQEALIKVYRYLPEYEARAKFSTWLYRVTVNACTDYLRKKNRQASSSLEKIQEEGYDWADVSPQGQPEPALLSQENRSDLRRCMARMPLEYRAAVVLRDVRGLSYEEVATVLDCSLGTVKSRINRGRRMLRDMIQGKK